MREDAGFSQEKFAQKIQIDRSYHGRNERGRQHISSSTICTIAGGLRVSPAVLLADLTISDCSEPSRPEILTIHVASMLQGATGNYAQGRLTRGNRGKNFAQPISTQKPWRIYPMLLIS